MFDVRTSRTNTLVAEQLRKRRRHILRAVIAKNEVLNRANFESDPISRYAPGSRSAREYSTLAQEVAQLGRQ